MEHFTLCKKSIVTLLEMMGSPVTIKMSEIMQDKSVHWYGFNLSEAVFKTADMHYDPECDLFEYNHFSEMPHKTYGWVTGSGNILIIRDMDGKNFSAWCTGGNILQWLEDLDFEESMLDELPLEGDNVLSLLDETE